jgi:thiosulfate reductase / polysulfide reductase chain A
MASNDAAVVAPTVAPTTCWECSTCCGALVTTRAGVVTDVAPNPAHPGSKGAFCIKGIRGMPGLTYAPNRLLHPLRRVGARGAGEWQRVSWAEALDEMAARLAGVRERYGPLAIAGATSGAYFSRSVVHALTLRSLGSPNWMINQDLCGGCRGVSDMVTGLAIAGGEDVDHARAILIVGANPHAANPVLWAALKRAKQRGARFVVIDPLATPTTDLADVWLRPRLGTDAAIALAMANVIIGEGRHDAAFVAAHCHGFDAFAARVAEWPVDRAAATAGVRAEDIVAAARSYADGPATFVSGHGIDAVSNGVQTFRAFHALVAITGNVDRVGGNRRQKRPGGFRNYSDLLYDPAFRLPLEVEAQAIGAERFPLWAGPEGWQKACHNPSVIEAVLTGRPYPVRALYVSGVNIAVTYPDSARTLEALRALDFLAVATQSMNPTAAVADLVLPKTTTLEEEEVSLNASAPCVNFTAAVAARQGEARPEIEIAAELLDRLEARRALAKRFVPWRTQRELNEYLLSGSDISIGALVERGFATFPFELGRFDAQPFKTPSGKIELSSERMARAGLDPLPDYVPPASAARAVEGYPLRLQTGLREKAYHHSRFRDQAWARRLSPDPLARMHPSTASALGLVDGDWVEVATPGVEGRCRLRASVSERVPPEVVATGMGWWQPDGAGPTFGALDININAALSYAGPYDPANGSPDSRGIPCRVTKLARAAA